MQEQSTKEGPETEDWRVQVLNAVSTVFGALGIPLCIWMTARSALIPGTGHFYLITLSVATFAVCAVWRRGPFHVRTTLILVALLAAQAASLNRGGFVIGTFMLGLLLTMLAGVLLGIWQAVASVVVTTSVLLVASQAYARDWLPSDFDPNNVDPTNPAVASRFSLVYGLFASTITVGVAVVIRHLNSSLRQTSQALAELKTANASRDLAERERREAQEQVIQAQKLEVVGQLASSVAHDFNNSLQVVMGCTGLLESTALGKAEEETIFMIQSACEHSANLASQLLVLGRNQTLQFEVVDLSSLLRSFQKTLNRLLPSDIELIVDLAETPDIYADEVQVQQVLLNLVLNARDAIDGPGKIAIRLDTTDDGQVQVIVEDNGCGMSEELIEHAFEPFFTTKSEDRGSGLGLAAVRRIMESHKGTIDASARPGGGTRMTMLFPSTNKRASAMLDATTGEVSIAGARVLIVDDNPAVLEVLEHVLAAANCKATAARDGEAALRAMREQASEFDLVITDAVMPGLSCADLIKELRKLSPAVPILICSAHVESELIRRGIETRQYRCLRKPFFAKDLILEVASALRAADVKG